MPQALVAGAGFEPASSDYEPDKGPDSSTPPWRARHESDMIRMASQTSGTTRCYAPKSLGVT